MATWRETLFTTTIIELPKVRPKFDTCSHANISNYIPEFNKPRESIDLDEN